MPWPLSESVPRPLKSVWKDQYGDSAGSIRPKSCPTEQVLCLEHDSIMMLVRFGDLSQSDCSKWVMWQVKDPQPRPGWDGCLTWEKMVYEKSFFFFFLVNKFGYGLKKKCFDFMVWIFFFISQFDKTTRIISVWSEFYWISIGINYPTVVNKKRNIGKNNKWHVKYFCCCLFF